MCDHTPKSEGGIPLRARAGAGRRDSRLLSAALQEFDDIGIREILDQDSRPTFVIDLDPDLDLTPGSTLLPLFGNTAIRTYERLWDVVCGVAHGEPSSNASTYKDFQTWIKSRTAFDDSADIFPSTYVYLDMLWTGSTVRKRWRFISGNKCLQIPATGAIDSFRGSLSNHIGSTYGEGITGQDGDVCKQPQHSLRPEMATASSLPREALNDSEESSIVTSFSYKPLTRWDTAGQSSHASTMKSGPSVCLDVDHSATDWTCPNPKGALSAHVQFARSIDWTATPLGVMNKWSRELRQLANLVMKNPHPGMLERLSHT